MHARPDPKSSPARSTRVPATAAVRHWWNAVRGRGAGISGVYRDLTRWAAIAVPIGIVAGVGATAFYLLITLFSDLLLGGVAGITLPVDGTLDPSQLAWSSSFPRVLILPVLLVAGGLAVGLLARGFAPEIAGHGTDATIRAFHRNAGKVRARVPLLKLLASTITLGTGGSGGREGPVSQIGGGFGSAWADLVGLSDRDRRIALATGMGAGIGAIFRAPLGGAVYSAEILYTGDFEPEVFVPAIIASVVAYSVYSSFLGFSTLFATPPSIASYAFSPLRLPLYAVLGVVCGVAGILFVRMFHRTDTWFRTRRWPTYLRPAVGAAMASAAFLGGYLLLPQEGHFAALSSLSVGYGFVQAAMVGSLSNGQFTVIVIAILLAAVLLRMVMTSFVVGSGGSAGLFGTSVVVGAFLGTAVGGTFHELLPGLVSLPVVAVFSIVGMMSFFGGVSKAPLGVLIMVVEMVGSYAVLPAAMVTIFIAYVVTGRWHLYTEQVPTRIESPAHLEEYRSYFLRGTTVAEVALRDSERVPISMSVEEALHLAVTHGRAAVSVEDGAGWVGVVPLRKLLGTPADQRGQLQVGDLAGPADLILPGDLPVGEGLLRMEQAGVAMASVMSADEPIRIVGLVTLRGLRLAGHVPPR